VDELVLAALAKITQGPYAQATAQFTERNRTIPLDRSPDASGCFASNSVRPRLREVAPPGNFDVRRFQTYMRFWKSLVIFSVAVVLIGNHAATAQTKKRLLPFPEWSLDNTDDELSLELIDIKIDGKPIALDKPFDADEKWLKNMTLRVKNIGTKSIVAFAIGGGLLHRVEEELPTRASFQYGIAWNWGKRFNPDNEKPDGAKWMPGETIELTYANVDSLTRRVLAREKEGAFCKLEFMAPGIQYADGNSPVSPPMRFRKAL
jgi:hypothetical protein